MYFTPSGSPTRSNSLPENFIRHIFNSQLYWHSDSCPRLASAVAGPTSCWAFVAPIPPLTQLSIDEIHPCISPLRGRLRAQILFLRISSGISVYLRDQTPSGAVYGTRPPIVAHSLSSPLTPATTPDHGYFDGYQCKNRQPLRLGLSKQ